MDRRFWRGSGSTPPFFLFLISASFSASGQCYRVPGVPLYPYTLRLSFGSGLCTNSANPCSKLYSLLVCCSRVPGWDLIGGFVLSQLEWFLLLYESEMHYFLLECAGVK
jgi:hypothetical protein